jgi:hypothetical protein
VRLPAGVGALLLLAGCGEPELPAVRTYEAAEPCGLPAAPEPEVLLAPTDLGTCLSAVHRGRSATLAVGINQDGRAITAEQVQTLCGALGPDGQVISPITLSAAETACAVERLRAWRFSVFATCAPQVTYLEVRAALPTQEQVPSGERAASRGGPIKRCGVRQDQTP